MNVADAKKGIAKAEKVRVALYAKRHVELNTRGLGSYAIQTIGILQEAKCEVINPVMLAELLVEKDKERDFPSAQVQWRNYWNSASSGPMEIRLNQEFHLCLTTLSASERHREQLGDRPSLQPDESVAPVGNTSFHS